MFGNGYHIQNSNFYKVGGDVNLQTHHNLIIQNHQSATLPLPTGSTLGLRIRGQIAESQRGLAGVARHGKTVKRAPYDPASRPYRSGDSSGDERPSSSNSRTVPPLIPSAAGLSGPVPTGGTFITAENVNHNHRPGESAGMNHLHRQVALDALYDSADSFPQPRCHPETRTEILDDLYNWAIKNDSVQPIHWLHGPAGAGKSAIMQTLCQKLQDAGRLGGAFFFKRGHTTRGNAKVLFATLGYQLALNDRRLYPSISQNVEHDPSIVGRHMDVQLRKLILEPCQSLTDSSPPILLIDGLDECQDEGTQAAILRLIGSTVLQFPNTFRLLIASRPEAHIRDIFEDPSFHVILNSTNIERAFEDIRTYFRDEFARIHREHRDTMGIVRTPWPSPEILENLVEKSSGYFVLFSTPYLAT
ncbi:hypothetical protein B0H19DRAFT_1376003 [Mycena capillaripes]|nr:hypothetical protein B0H19DRAFT_1376003 [Mycena capillaripes]